MIDERLSRDIEVGAIARPRYSTDVLKSDGGFTFTNERWRYPLFEFEFNLEPGDPFDESAEDPNAQTLKEFIHLWHCAGGRANTFLFRHWGDYRARGDNIGTGDGVTDTFQLYRVYQAGAITRLRKITRPEDGTDTLYVDGSPVSATTDYETGIVTFAAPPGAGSQITADFDFFLPVRFADDEIDLVALTGVLEKPMNLTLEEERERSA